MYVRTREIFNWRPVGNIRRRFFELQTRSTSLSILIISITRVAEEPF